MSGVAVDLVRLDVDRPRDVPRPLPFVANLRLAEHDSDRRQPRSAPLPSGHADDRRRVEPTRNVGPDRVRAAHSARHRIGERGPELVDVVLLVTAERRFSATPLPVPFDADAPLLCDQEMPRLEP